MEKDVIDFRRQVRAVKNGRWIYAAALALLLGLGVFYFFSYSPKYDITSRLLIEDDEDGGGVRSAGSMSSIMRTFSVGGFGAASIDNELLIADTRDVMKRMVKTLGLNRIYAKKEGMRSSFAL